MVTMIDHAPLEHDEPRLRPELATSMGLPGRMALGLGAVTVGATVGLAAAPSASSALTGAVIASGVLTALAANWSTCGMSVAGVVVAPKQPGRKGSSTPLRRLGWHALGSVATGSVTGAAIGALGGLALGWLSAPVALGIWAVLALAYGLHEQGVLPMPTPMRRRQLPRHLRRRMEPWKVSLVFGAIIGPGFLIFIRSSAYYLLALGVAAVGSPALGAALFVTVSLGRCMPSALAILHVRRGGTIPGFLTTMCLVDRRVQAITGAALLGLGVFGCAALI
ncbi:methylamine utilization protein [Gordonia sp. DT30]|uniref:methylamine utilization protein n=1 Tax=Gordonia sp. DT30 TaxID=3416546 RepID=UPI003CFB45D5